MSAPVLLSASPADFNADGLVDLADYELLEECTNGPKGMLLNDDCLIADIDGDGRVDLLDFALFQVLSVGAA